MCAAPARGRTRYTRRMSIASALMGRRRQLVLGTVTVLLHLVVFDWVSGQVGLAHVEPVRASTPMLAQLIAAAPAPAPTPAPPPQPELSLPPLPALDPEPVAVAAPPAPPAPAPTPSAAAPDDAQAPAGDAGTQAAGQASAAPAAG